MNLTPFVILWSILAVAVLGLALYRKLIANHEGDLIHVGPGAEKLVPQQIRLAARLEFVDRWGKTLTVIVAAAGSLIAAAYLFLNGSMIHYLP